MVQRSAQHDGRQQELREERAALLARASRLHEQRVVLQKKQTKANKTTGKKKASSGKKQQKELQSIRAALEELMVDCMNAVGIPLYSKFTELEAAVGCFQLATEIGIELHGEESAEVAGTRNNMAIVYQKQHRFDEALELYGQVLEVQCRVFGEDSAEVAGTRMGMAIVYEEQHRFDEALPARSASAVAYEAVLGSGAVETCNAKRALANLHLQMATWQQPEHHRAQVLTLFQQVLDADSEILESSGHSFHSTDWFGHLSLLAQLEGCYQQLGQPDEAGEMYAQQAAWCAQHQLDGVALQLWERALDCWHGTSLQQQRTDAYLCMSAVAGDCPLPLHALDWLMSMCCGRTTGAARIRAAVCSTRCGGRYSEH